MKILNLFLFRTHLKQNYTIGNLYHTFSDCKGKNMNILSKGYLCDTLEDTFRGNNLKGKKVYGQTCIPEGNYKIKMTYSNKFKKELPELLNVPYFEGIRIHQGNKPEDSEGCLLCGENKLVGKVINSTIKTNEVISLIEKADETYITIRNL